MNNKVQSVKDKIRNISKKKDVDFNAVMRFYMYDRFIERLSKSNYKDNFILKGGFYLSRLFGVDNRSTMDIDTALRNANLNEENIIKMITETINVRINDGVIFKIESTRPLRSEDEYGGLRVTIVFKLENMKDKFHIDIVTGDPIYPYPNSYNYDSLIDDKKYKVWTYNLETILSEKIETILSKLETSSRMKDYYDIYLIYKLKYNEINKHNFRGAIEKTFSKRNFKYDLKDNFNIVKNSNLLREKWLRYTRKNNYASNIKYDDIIECLNEFIEIIVTVNE